MELEPGKSRQGPKKDKTFVESIYRMLIGVVDIKQIEIIKKVLESYLKEA